MFNRNVIKIMLKKAAFIKLYTPLISVLNLFFFFPLGTSSLLLSHIPPPTKRYISELPYGEKEKADRKMFIKTK